jgi:hypothetical protein
MKYVVDQCSMCGRMRPIVNKKYTCCDKCNHFRLNANKPKPAPKIKKTRPHSKSREQAEIDKQLRLVYEEIAREREHVCTGCGTTRNLSHSHLISRGKRRDLICNKQNIKYHCLSTPDRVGCHQIWESDAERRILMNDYEENMVIIKELDPQEYEMLRWKEEEYLKTKATLAEVA